MENAQIQYEENFMFSPKCAHFFWLSFATCWWKMVRSMKDTVIRNCMKKSNFSSWRKTSLELREITEGLSWMLCMKLTLISSSTQHGTPSITKCNPKNSGTLLGWSKYLQHCRVKAAWLPSALILNQWNFEGEWPRKVHKPLEHCLGLNLLSLVELFL